MTQLVGNTEAYSWDLAGTGRGAGPGNGMMDGLLSEVSVVGGVVNRAASDG